MTKKKKTVSLLGNKNEKDEKMKKKKKKMYSLKTSLNNLHTFSSL